MSDNLDNLLDSLLLTESQEDAAKTFYRVTRKNRPEMASDLAYAADHAIDAVRAGESPGANIGNLQKVFRHNPDVDPSQSGDTFGVKTFIDVMAQDKEEAGDAKRYYTNSLKAMFSDLFEMTEEEFVKKRDKNTSTVNVDGEEKLLLMDDDEEIDLEI